MNVKNATTMQNALTRNAFAKLATLVMELTVDVSVWSNLSGRGK